MKMKKRLTGTMAAALVLGVSGTAFAVPDSPFEDVPLDSDTLTVEVEGVLDVDVSFVDPPTELTTGEAGGYTIRTENSSQATRDLEDWYIGMEVESFGGGWSTTNPPVDIEACYDDTFEICTPIQFTGADVVYENGILYVIGGQEGHGLEPGDANLQNVTVTFHEAGSFTGNVYVFEGDSNAAPQVVTGGTGLQDAIDAAGADGGTVLVDGGTYSGTYYLAADGVRVIANGATIVGSFDVSGDDVTISGFDFSGYTLTSGNAQVAVSLRGAENVAITGNTFVGLEGEIDTAIETVSGAAVSGVVEGNTITSNNVGVYNNPGSSLDIRDNTFAGNYISIGVDSADGVDISDNTFTGAHHEGFYIELFRPNATVVGNTFGEMWGAYVIDVHHDYDMSDLWAANTFPAWVVPTGNTIQYAP